MDDELPDLAPPISEADQFRGTWGAKYTLVEFGDYQSEHCFHLAPIVHELLNELGDDLCYVYRHFPQPKLHPQARFAAEAAESAGLQAKFWLMHDRLFERQGELAPDDVREIARGLPVDMHRFETDLTNGEAAQRVSDDVASGEESGVGDTPCLFVNGHLHTGSYEFGALLDALRETPRTE